MDVRIVAAGDAAWLIELPERLDAEVNARAVEIARRIEREKLPFVSEVVVGYRSVMVYVDPLADAADAAGTLDGLTRDASDSGRASGASVTIPVCYGGELGPDLEMVASLRGLTAAEVIARHTAAEYRVYMLGFVPGFPYMAHVDPSIAVPRRKSPRVRVPAGSVAIANEQTGIYPAETPGGWNIIGRCPVKPYDPSRREPFLLRAGDRVRFRPIPLDEYRESSAWGDV